MIEVKGHPDEKIKVSRFNGQVYNITRSEARFARLLLVCDLLSYIHWMNVGGQVKGSTENECYTSL